MSWRQSVVLVFLIIVWAVPASAHNAYPPTVTIGPLGPAANVGNCGGVTYVRGAIDIPTTATDDVAIDKTDLDKPSPSGQSYDFSPDTTPASHTFSWSTSPDGPTSITATTYDTSGKTDTDSVSVFVDNTAPTCSVKDPPNGGHITKGNQVYIRANAADNGAVARVEFYVDGALKSTDTAAPWEYVWDTSTYSLGNHTIYAKAFDCPGNSTQSATITVSLVTSTYSVTSVVWEAMDSALHDNPSSMGGGKCIYPDWPTSTAPSPVDKYRKVRAKATISPVIQGVVVAFQVFDVDDPSADATPVDGTDIGGNPYGGDNRGTPSLDGFALTDANGVASVVLTVSMHPGDNFRVAARADADYLAGCHTNNTPSIKDASGNTVSEDHMTDMLTVWRRLHVEVDSMGPEYDTGTSTGLTATVLTDATKHWATYQFNLYGEDWQLNPDTTQGTTFSVSNTTTNTIVVSPGDMTAVAQAGDPYRVAFAGLAADDSLTGDVQNPDIGASSSAFESAYITALQDTGWDSGTTPWHYHFPSNPDFGAYCLGGQEQRGSKDDEREDYWVVYIVGIYELLAGDPHDNDPDSEVASLGHTFEIAPGASSEWAEVDRDLAAERSWSEAQRTAVRRGTALHEIGEQFGLEHDQSLDQNGIPCSVMWAPATGADELKLPNVPLLFSATHLRAIRDIPYP